MQIKRIIFWTASLLAAAMLWGCGSNGSGGSDVEPTPTPDNVQVLGIDNCLTCHLDGAGSTAAVWLEGVHGNADIAPSQLTATSCVQCHDPLGDGQLLASATNGVVPNRPVIGCESCHGGGSAHRGVGPLPYPEPGHEQCGECHNDAYPHGSEERSIVEDFVGSPHANSIPDPAFVDETSDVRARCAKCHTDEGAELYRDIDGDYAALTAALPNEAAPVADATSIDCNTCHMAHHERDLLEMASAGRSSEFNTCTNCHQLVDQNGNKITAYHDPEANPHGALNEIITDTHFATPGEFPGSERGQNQNDITGYALNFSDEDVCTNCHNPHKADTEIHQQWAQSAHADTSAAGAWAHYNWTETGVGIRTDGSATSDRTSCQRCHTTRGLVKFLTETDGNAHNYVPFMDYQPNYEPQMLHCNGCHSDNLGALRSVGAITIDYTNAPHTYPDVQGSNICISCHSGRERGETIKNASLDFTDASFINSHYLTAGGTVFGVTGYEYNPDGDPATDDYEKVPFYAHDSIGTPAEPGTGDEGPCIGCHLTSPESHSFQPVERNEETGEITEITSTVCSECHAGEFELTPAELNEEKEHLHASLETLAEQLAAVGHPFLGGYPYFASGDWTNGGFYDGMDLMGAAFNYNLLEHDPGAYAHNRFYAKRLIYDSIDYVDNVALDQSVGVAIDALVEAGALDAAEAAMAKAYLDGDNATAGVQRPE